jgi:hypothetical protein
MKRDNVIKILVLTIIMLLTLHGIIVPIAAENDSEAPRGARQTLKDMTFYMHNSSSARYIFDYSTTYTFNTTLGTNTTSIWDQQRVRMNWYLHPVLAGDFSVNGQISVVAYINTKGVSANPNLKVEIWDVTYKSAGSETWDLIYSGSNGVTVQSGIESYQIDINDVAHTFVAGHSIRIYYEIQGGASAEFGLWYGNDTYDSRITFQAYDHLEVEDIKTKDYQDVEKSNFLLNEADKTIKMQANVTDPFGGYDIKMAKLTLTDPSDSVILDNVSMLKITGTPISFANIYEVQWDYSGAQVGQYQITVWAVDNNGYYYFHHKEKYNYGYYPDINTTTFFIGGLPQSGTVTVNDKGNPQQALTGAVVKVLQGSTTIFRNTTDSNGQTDLNMYPGIYDIIVEWQDVVVGTEADYNVVTDFTLTIDCDVYYPDFQVVDNAGAPLEGANVYLGHPNGSFLIQPFITDSTGSFSITQAPIGDYNLIVKWRDVEVANVDVLINKNGLIQIIVAKVFLLELTLVDSQDVGIPGAQIIIADSISRLILDSKLSNVNGYMNSQLPVGDYNITVYWQQRVIQQFDLIVDNDMNITVECWVYYVSFKTVDPHDLPVENARIVFTDPETLGVFDSQITDGSGGLESVLPLGPLNIDVYWKDTHVHSSQIDITGDIPSTSPITLICDIYYLTLTVVDSKGIEIQDAQIILTSDSTGEVVDSQISDSDGEIISRLPVGGYDISVRWYDTNVYFENNKMVDQDESYQLNCRVYYLVITAVDSHNTTLIDAQISVTMISTGNLFAGELANETGTNEFRLPVGTYEIDVVWEGVNVKSETNYSLVSDNSILLKCNVFYFSVKAVDIDNVPLEKARVTIRFNSDGKVYDSQWTDLDGTIESRIPIEYYNIEVTWKEVSVYFESKHYINSDDIYTVNAKVFYLIIKAIDNEKEPLKDVSITVSGINSNILENQYTNKQGNTEFRLPIDSYNYSARLQTTYLLKDIDLKEQGQVELNNNSETVTIKFKDYPPPLTDTPLFLVIMVIIIFMIIIILTWFLVIRKLKKDVKEEDVEKPLAIPVIPKVKPNKMMVPLASTVGDEKVRADEELKTDVDPEPPSSPTPEASAEPTDEDRPTVPALKDQPEEKIDI